MFMENEKTNSTVNSYLTFQLGDEIFSSHVEKVINILELVKITEVPRAPKFMKGVINLRGSVLPVVDARIKFGMDETQSTKDTCIIVCEVKMENEDLRIGAIVDAVKEVVEVSDAEILPPPGLGSKYKSEFITGVIKRGDDFIMNLDMDKAFSTDEIMTLKMAEN